MKRIQIFVYFTICFLSFAIFAEPQKPEFVFLFIGDGMGEIQIVAAGDAKKARDSEALVFTSFPVKGWQKTSSANAKVTDSAAAVTAIACGQKTNNGMLGVDPKGTELPSIAEIAHEQGWRIGILTSVSLDHATPAGFYAKDRSRNNFSAIARTLAKSNFEFFGGGGLAGQKSEEGDKDNLQLAKENGFKIVRTRDELGKISDAKKVLAFNHRLSGGASLPWALDTNDDDIRLSEFTKAAIDYLKDGKFFIMVEGGKIDWACHSNDLVACVMEILEFDKAVSEAVEFYKKNPQKTLIVVTADHETGALKQLEKSQPENIFSLKKSSEKINSALKNLQKDKASFDNALLVLKENVSLEFYDNDLEKLKKAWEDYLNGVENKSLYGKENPVISVLNKIIANRARFQYTSIDHSAADVPVYAIGAGADEFSGNYENTEIFNKLKRLMNLQDVSK